MDVAHIVVEVTCTVLGSGLAVWGASWLGRRADKKAREEHEAKTEYLLREYGFHDHTESGGDETPLTKGGIRRPRVNGREET